MTGTQKIKTLLKHEKISMSELARRLGTSPQALGQKMKRDTFTLQELEHIAYILQIGFESNFICRSGEKI